jgi:hypothetical protein
MESSCWLGDAPGLGQLVGRPGSWGQVLGLRGFLWFAQETRANAHCPEDDDQVPGTWTAHMSHGHVLGTLNRPRSQPGFGWLGWLSWLAGQAPLLRAHRPLQPPHHYTRPRPRTRRPGIDLQRLHHTSNAEIACMVQARHDEGSVPSACEARSMQRPRDIVLLPHLFVLDCRSAFPWLPVLVSYLKIELLGNKASVCQHIDASNVHRLCCLWPVAVACMDQCPP